ncbi:MAG: DUF4349 domain-containing protein [Lachnospiraceae bacterium]|nr:DUF4349 domain-containing protein [Lachnospiraceae bacterium]
MKKHIRSIAVMALAVVLLAGCGKSESAAYPKAVNKAYEDYYMEGSTGAMLSDTGVSYSRGAAEAKSSPTSSPSNFDSDNSGTSQGVVSRKVIKNAYLEVQTLKFDEFVAELKAKVEEFGGYYESANLSGNNIYSTSSRRANYTIRVPEDKIEPMMSSIGEIGTVITSSYNENDITLAYVDVESRIKTLTTEQETLLGLLEKAAYLEDIIRLEQRLSEVNYELETYKSRQRNYDDKISYSTLNIDVREVQRVSIVAEEPLTLGERIAKGFKDNMLNIKEGLENFIVWFISYIVNIIIFCGVVAVVVILLVKYAKKTGKRRANIRKEADTDQEKSEK